MTRESKKNPTGKFRCTYTAVPAFVINRYFHGHRQFFCFSSPDESIHKETKFPYQKGIPARGQIFVSDTSNRLKLYLINDCVSWPCARRPYVHLCRHDEDRQTASAEITDLPQSCLLTARHLMRKALLMPTAWSSTDTHWLYMMICEFSWHIAACH